MIEKQKTLQNHPKNAPDMDGLFQAFEQWIPDPQCELDHTDPFSLLIGVVLSAQSTDVGVNKATPALFEHVKTPQDLLDLGLEKLIPFIRSIGLYRRKAVYLMQIAEILVAKYQGQVPDSEEHLIKLPGIGLKSAHVILNVCFQKPVIAVDTHVFRVSHRMGLADAKTADAVTAQLQETIPLKYRRQASHWLVLHGRYVCKARKPLCQTCRVRKWCQNPVSG